MTIVRQSSTRVIRGWALASPSSFAERAALWFRPGWKRHHGVASQADWWIYRVCRR